jgi:hypothetical protein
MDVLSGCFEVRFLIANAQRDRHTKHFFSSITVRQWQEEKRKVERASNFCGPVCRVQSCFRSKMGGKAALLYVQTSQSTFGGNILAESSEKREFLSFHSRGNRKTRMDREVSRGLEEVTSFEQVAENLHVWKCENGERERDRDH